MHRFQFVVSFLSFEEYYYQRTSEFSTLVSHAVSQKRTHFQWKFNPDPRTLASPEICVGCLFTSANQAFKNQYRTNEGSLAVGKPATGYRIPLKYSKKYH